jgi:hypothetical protein
MSLETDLFQKMTILYSILFPVFFYITFILSFIDIHSIFCLCNLESFDYRHLTRPQIQLYSWY